MASVFDVAVYFLSKLGSMSAMKLQKLCYYSQAWSLAWDGRKMFRERIEAWANGPVCPLLYNKHKGLFEVNAANFNDLGKADVFDDTQKETLAAVLDFYGDKSPHWLSELTHAEQPWKDARKGLQPGERGNAEIPDWSMSEYYGSL